MSSITLHPEYGVNPAMDVCWWCGEVSGVAMLGRNKGQKAPRYVMSSKEPCPKCEERIKAGCLYVFEATAPDKYDPDQEPKRTNRMSCLTKEAGDNVRSIQGFEKVKHAVFLEPELYEKMFGHLPEKKPEG